MKLVLVLLLVLAVAGCGAGAKPAAPVITVGHGHHAVPVGRFGGPPPAAPAVGDVLFTSSGQWSGSPTGFAYAWKDCDSSGLNCVTAAGSPTNTTRYQIVSGDNGFTIRVAVTASYSGHPDSTVLSAATAVVGGTFPLSVSSNGRYLQTSGGLPFLMVGDSPQSGMGNLSTANMTTYLADRAAHGFNTVWENLLCIDYTYCNADGTTYDSIKPFTTGTAPSSYDLSTPNATYFARMHSEVAQAAADGIEIMLDPIEGGGCSGGWTGTLANNGNGTISTTDKDYQYGQFLGNTFKDLNNIIWLNGNDWFCYGGGSDNNNLTTVANGIASTDPGALQTLETSDGATSLDDPTFSTVANINASYTYGPAYGTDLHARGQTPTMPMFLGETVYEQENLNGDGCITVRNCRLQEWWTMTSGATGQLYGCHCTTHLANTDFPLGSSIDTTGVTELGYQTTLLSSLGQWYNLVPYSAGTNTFVTAGGGSCPTTGSIVSVTCVTSAETTDNHLALVYIPISTSITVDMSKMSGTTTARWYDPTNGTFTTVTGSPFTAASHVLPAPGNNHSGDSDWVLVLQS